MLLHGIFFAWVAVAKYHKLFGLKHRNLFSHKLEVPDQGAGRER